MRVRTTWLAFGVAAVLVFSAAMNGQPPAPTAAAQPMAQQPSQSTAQPTQSTPQPSQSTAQPAQGGAQPARPANGPGNGGQRFPMAPVGVPVVGMPFVHDPSTVVHFQGRYWVFATGRGVPFYSSPDGMTWTREGSVFQQIPDDVHALVPKNDGSGVWAPDVIRMNGQFYLYYAVSSWGSFQSAIGLATNPTLDPKDPAYKWTDRGVVVSSNGNEDLNAIDPGVVKGPDGRVWICYGSYHGSIRVTQLNPRTGLALRPGRLGAAIATARESEASDIIFHGGYYYLFVNHNSCCKGRNSEYNIRVGRARAVTGPYLDKHGRPMAEGGGSLFLAAHDHRIGPGHFGRVVDYDTEPIDGASSGDATTGAVEAGSEAAGAERFSLHYEGDLTRNGRSVLDIRPLLWSLDGWPAAGDNPAEGAYQLVSNMSENTLEEHVPGAAAAPSGGTPPRADPAFPAATAEPAGPPVARLNRYLTLDNQKWTIAPVANGFYKIVNAATGHALEAGNGSSGGPTGVALGAYTGTDAQMWHLDQFPDGGWRIRNKQNGLSLAASGGGLVLGSFTRDDAHLWTVTTP